MACWHLSHSDVYGSWSGYWWLFYIWTYKIRPKNIFGYSVTFSRQIFLFQKRTKFHKNNLFHPKNVPPEPRSPGAVAPLTSRSLHHSQCVKLRGGLLWLATVCHPVLKKTGDIIKFAFLFFVNTVEWNKVDVFT